MVRPGAPHTEFTEGPGTNELLTTNWKGSVKSQHVKYGKGGGTGRKKEITYKVVAFFFFFSSPPPPRVHGRSMNQRLRTHSKELIGMASCSLNLDYTGLIYLSGLTGRRYLMG